MRVENQLLNKECKRIQDIHHDLIKEYLSLKNNSVKIQFEEMVEKNMKNMSQDLC